MGHRMKRARETDKGRGGGTRPPARLPPLLDQECRNPGEVYRVDMFVRIVQGEERLIMMQ
jgi:hypothetical protein